MFKKIVITSYDLNGKQSIVMTLTTKKSIVANDYEQARNLVAQVIQSHVLNIKKFSVQWKREGYPEGYLVVRE